MRIYIALGAAVLLAACSSQDDKFNSACTSMMKKADEASKQEIKQFCGCFTDETKSMDKKPRNEFIKLMKAQKKGDKLEEELEKAVEKGKMSQSDAKDVFTAMKGCALDMSM